jgi:hypothetical protein
MRSNIPKINLTIMRELIRKEFTAKQLSTYFGCTTPNVYAFAKRNGVKLCYKYRINR